MACFVAPAVVAVATTVANTTAKKRAKSGHAGHGLPARWMQRLGWLNTMLWTATILSAIEHAINGELSAYPPFFTALQTSGAGAMLREIAINGVVMTAAVVVVWALVVAIAWQRETAKSLAA